MPDFELDEGLLTKRISIYRATTGTSVLNEPTTAGTLLASVWAELNPKTKLRAREVSKAGADGARIEDTWRVRYRSDVQENMRIHWNSQQWRISSVDILGAKQGLDIQAVRIA